MKLDALRGINSFIQFHDERPRFSNPEVSGIWQEALPQFSFMDHILRNLHQTTWLSTPLTYTTISHLYAFILGISPIKKCFLPPFIYSSTAHPSRLRPKPILTSFPWISVWNDLSIFWTPTTVVLRPPASKVHHNLYFYKYQKELWQCPHCFPKSILPLLKE